MGNVNFAGIDTSRCPALNNLAGEELVNQYFEDLIKLCSKKPEEMVLEDFEREIVEDALQRACTINSNDLLKKIKEIYESIEDSSIVHKFSDDQVKALNGSHTCMMLKQCKLGTFINDVVDLLNSDPGPDKPDEPEEPSVPPILDEPKIREKEQEWQINDPVV